MHDTAPLFLSAPHIRLMSLPHPCVCSSKRARGTESHPCSPLPPFSSPLPSPFLSLPSPIEYCLPRCLSTEVLCTFIDQRQKEGTIHACRGAWHELTMGSRQPVSCSSHSVHSEKQLVMAGCLQPADDLLQSPPCPGPGEGPPCECARCCTACCVEMST